MKPVVLERWTHDTIRHRLVYDPERDQIRCECRLQLRWLIGWTNWIKCPSPSSCLKVFQ